jgi:hypothetical protein
MLDAGYADSASGVPRRRLAITNVGVPIVYSHKSTQDHERAPPFRMLVEPGGTGRTVTEQIGFASDVLRDVLGHLEWQPAGEHVEAVLGKLLPHHPGAFKDWRAGFGFGIEISDTDVELRIYCNLWHGALIGRWRRLIAALAEFSDGRRSGSARGVLLKAIPRAHPVGVGLAVSDGHVRGMRLYFGLAKADARSAIDAAPDGFTRSAPAIRALIETYGERFGHLERSDITLAYDFIVQGGKLELGPTRFKVDLYCEPASRAARLEVLKWIEERIRAEGLDPSSLQRFVSELDAAFSGTIIQYVSLGCTHRAEDIAVYCIPGRWPMPDDQSGR